MSRWIDKLGRAVEALVATAALLLIVGGGIWLIMVLLISVFDELLKLW